MTKKLKEIIHRIGVLEGEAIVLETELESMEDRLRFLEKSENQSMPIIDKRRYTRERLGEIRAEIALLQAQKETEILGGK